MQRGIYRLVQFPGSPYEDMFVAWLRVGPQAVISHESALYLYNLSDVLPTKVHVIMPRTGSRRRADLRLHTQRLSKDEVTTREGLPMTTPARTIMDVAASGVAEEQLFKAIHEAIRRGLATEKELRSIANHHSGRGKRLVEKNLKCVIS